LTKAQVESFPAYKETDLESDEQWADYEGRYRSKWEADPVMHRAETDRNVTPTTQQTPGNSVSAQVIDPAEEDTGVFEGFAASTSSVVIPSTAVGIGPRWDTFQDRLRERRKEVIGTEEQYRKAG
jgi:hypothetical protein